MADLLCLYGHNVAEVKTVLWERMLSARRRNGTKIIVADPRKSPTVRQGADLHLQLRLATSIAPEPRSVIWRLRLRPHPGKSKSLSAAARRTQKARK